MPMDLTEVHTLSNMELPLAAANHEAGEKVTSNKQDEVAILNLVLEFCVSNSNWQRSNDEERAC